MTQMIWDILPPEIARQVAGGGWESVMFNGDRWWYRFADGYMEKWVDDNPNNRVAYIPQKVAKNK